MISLIDDIRITPLLLLFAEIAESGLRMSIVASRQKPASTVALHMFSAPARKEKDDLISCRPCPEMNYGSSAGHLALAYASHH